MQKDLNNIKNNIKKYLNNSKLCTVNTLADFAIYGYSKDLNITKLSNNQEYINELSDGFTNFASKYMDDINLEDKIKDFVSENMGDLLIHNRGLDYEILMSYDPEIKDIVNNFKNIVDNAPSIKSSIENRNKKQKSLAL
tara:strand:+ start:12530 stop:12946 length:417 start_codon:yes stop_codon:yes gene_type:complete